MIRQTALAFALACSVATAAAQVPAAPAAPVAPRPPVGTPPPAPPMPPAPPAPVAATPVSVTGTVERFMLNPNGEVDGLWLRDGTQVAFAPHLSGELQAAVRRGDAVTVQGYRLGSLPVLRASSIRSTRGGREVVDRPPTTAAMPPAPPAPAALTPLQAEGRIERLVYGPGGETNGALLSDGTLVRMPPHLALQFGDLLRTGAPLSVSGFGVATATGRAIEATQLGRDRASQRALFSPPRPDGPVPPAPPTPPVPPAAPPPPAPAPR
ncbi:hypothetical protein ABQZ99_001240 [Xanthomonas hortorum pv. vitians]|uniref:Secreted protein n=1 Tax=Xanthomonas hortorum pv. vitians TaxID=83224 RepID=A0A6V7BN85_9XANT|nr:hypothetical protein [Xanthomonas hortorum]APP86677.1 hypothetical protein BI317_23645 [Xanthomonas hortorum pv. gardneri]ASW47437.1 hypothetical protein XJ27_16820 [Xanthomonas hortorum]MCC8492482.1 hypothetical protein [Xanthomonas hortorum pv. gardneri]MCE4279448.1 hypothetical protein [Xanthomonas hortorum pv. vitians]MCE4283420.1 hypothetical protein [Xanthomonas hortorum pv. vitians]